ncbi:uncharacterized protein LOC105258504 [Camponotus floridanus]|uniref:uncharacterized protein LOC105258504 n=1 Tax=Camponotus floridanus TaxID=104421 RepID=UPI00059E7639|nr:uncharacterized protein LOC105258504 [Camponotus floridanus]
MTKIEATIRMQHELHHRISRVVENLKKLGKEKITLVTINTRLESLESNWKSFQTTHSALIAAAVEAEKTLDYFVTDYYDLTETAYFENKDTLLTLRQDSASPEAASDDSLNVSASRHSTARALPKITLPKFSGDYHSWPSFLFTSMIVSNADLLFVEKLHYLKNHVTGEAARRISNLAVTEDNFGPAWDALVARYENKRVLMSAYLDRLFGLQPLTRKSGDELKDLLATVKKALGSLHAL